MSKSTELLEEQLVQLLEEVRSYNTAPNKSKSKRVRTALGSIKKNVTTIRQELVALDRGGYSK